MEKPIWEGKYDSFSDMPNRRDSHYLAEGMEARSTKRLDAALEKYKSGELPLSPHSPLFVVAPIVAASKGTVTILDFGGGPGETFLETLSTLPTPNKLEYHIVELDWACTIGRSSLANFPNVTFHEAIPQATSYDIVHLNSSIQYVEDWKAMLATLCQITNDYLIFSDLPLVQGPSYCSEQEYYGHKIPCHFFNKADFISSVESQQMQLISMYHYEGTILGKRQRMPQSNFDVIDRVGNPSILIFQALANKDPQCGGAS